ncbi:NAD(P)/FAD-dependent oxidoreductase [Rivularia sp. UHCC 0363]|uniref:NAD(P)/FAD-dependent oxidoreductase n=1 Tax=Rivularia sp. UHCC 0363 TaxID=3110244 RepID=UPI002B1F0F4F|nr:FAD-dependent oxidoreductase [Rivularia sp. UHCC 0363]MEA5598128.1 FAD-dependent oxidoreductase [Rivularia sp. UHCC 0363]
MTNIAIVGAGMAGLVCAQQLTQAGYSVRVIDKSRGVGGRVATRRLSDTKADHGACYLKPKGELLQHLVKLLVQKGDLEVWTDTLHELEPNSSSIIPNSPSSLPYTAPEGMNVIAKFLAQGLEIHREQRVNSITLNSQNHWHLISDTNEEFTASSVVIAIPAPQAVMLLEPLAQLLDNSFWKKLRSVEFYPALTVMAGYADSLPQPEWKAITFKDNPVLGWIGLDSSKRKIARSHFVVHSSADFAERYFESELPQVGQQMLQTAASTLNLLWLNNPQWMQVHRWKYAFPKTPLEQSCLAAETPVPLVCCGDWCGGNLVESAMHSGIAAAEHINNKLEQRKLPGINFLDAL